MFDIIKNVILPALRDKIEKGCNDWVEYTLYSKPLDFSKTTPGVGNGKRIRVIGPIVTIY